MKLKISVKVIPMLAAAVLVPLAILAQTGSDQNAVTGIVSESHREGNVERRNPDRGLRSSGEVT